MAFGVPSIEDMTAYITQGAIARGMDPGEALRVARSEGLQPGVWQSNVIKNGVREPSYGPFQLYTGGGLGSQFQAKTGQNPADPSTWRSGVDFALDSAKSGGWGPWYGAKKQGIVGMPQAYNGSYQPALLAPPDPATAGGGMLDVTDPTVAGLPAGAAPAPAAYQAPGAPPPGIMNFLQSPMATGLASGLLMASGPSPTKIGMGQALGYGLEGMGKAQALAAANELKRDAISQQALSDQQTRVMNMMTMQGMIQAQQQKAQENKQTQAQLQTSTSMAYNAADSGYKAVQVLKASPIGEQLATYDPVTIHWLRKGVAAAKASGPGSAAWTQAEGLAAKLALSGMNLDVSTPEKMAAANDLLNSAEALNKQRSNLSAQLQNLANQGNRSAFALQNRLTGMAEGAGLDVNEEMFSFLRDQIETEAEAYGFQVGERPPPEGAKAPPSAAPAAPPATDASGAAPVLTPNSPLVTSTVPPGGNVPRGGRVIAGAGQKPITPTAPQRFSTQQQAHDWAVKQPPGTYTVVIGGVTYPITVSP